MIRSKLLATLILLLMITACTRQPPPPTATAIPISTLAPALTATMEAVRALPSYTPLPNTPTLTPFPFPELDLTAITEREIIRGIFDNQMTRRMAKGLEVLSPIDQISVAAHYEVNRGIPHQVELARQMAERGIGEALCDLQDAEVNARPVIVHLIIQDSNSSQIDTFDYRIETETITRMNCTDRTRIDLSLLTRQ